MPPVETALSRAPFGTQWKTSWSNGKVSERWNGVDDDVCCHCWVAGTRGPRLR